MKNIYSTLLKPMPRAAKPKRTRIPKRLLLIAIIAAFIILPFIIIVTRALPEDGPGYIFYWFHDHIFLPVKGYTYTLFYPFSLSWWGPVLTALAIWLIAYLTMVSFIKEPHVALLRKVITRSSKARHGFLISSSRWLKKMKMEPIFLREAVNMERKKSLHRLVNHLIPDTEMKDILGLIHLTQLHVELMTLPRVKNVKETFLQALLYWQQTTLQVLAPRENKSKYNDPRWAEIANRLAHGSENLILPLLNFKEETLLLNALEKPAAFDIDSVAVDFLYIAQIYNDSPSFSIPGVSSSVNKEKLTEIILARLADSVDRRRVIMEEICLRLQMLQRNRTGPLAANDSEIYEPLLNGLVDIDVKLKPDKTAFLLSHLGELGLSVAVHLSILAKDIDIALGYMDSLETFDFVFHCLEFQDGEEPESHLLTALKALNYFPGPGYYRLCARLSRKELEAYEKQWKASHLKDEGIINPSEFRLAAGRIESMSQTAGPPDPEEG